ncbi:hypothetical protein ES705_29754 [subsurface metagenome]
MGYLVKPGAGCGEGATVESVGDFVCRTQRVNGVCFGIVDSGHCGGHVTTMCNLGVGLGICRDGVFPDAVNTFPAEKDQGFTDCS